ncbi:MAG: 16S rRNA (adenine(1518)-N(6)/adenine(1519)-N(6))-dimethyltransferase RsmA [Clostridium sp.]|nr:16S rRNA (adenine(1518)-N(6)/adenine(1519)-N(6))-dimethyltransferase RsmA [Clostridium sp.]MCM1443790.1 16S rRNA (adenine(1518)-N(6)/adenine(1519)-N(6))-dimethyltransferase RsmA [Candidatus Amulumruptor caecigallinarius]
MVEYSPKQMSNLLEQNNFNFKKKFGQNFIIDENIVKNIVSKSCIDKETLVIEIGPGSGSLTSKLLEQAKNVLCYEIDKELKGVLDANLGEFSNLEVIYGDFLTASLKKDIEKYDYKKLYVISNLPYYITTPIIMKLIMDKIDVDKIVVMVQKEVGNRFKAKPGTRDYGSLSVFLSYYYDIKKIMDISKNVFMPKPNVDSIVVEFVKKEKLYILKDEEKFFNLIKDSFAQKRKNLRNNLKNYDLDIIESILKNYNFDLNARAEQLSLEIFVDIANSL